MSPSISKRPWLLLGVIGVQAFLCRGLLTGEYQLSRDLVRLFMPIKRHVWSELHAGRLPQWWPWEGLGMPIASQPLASIFHPTTLFYAFLPFQPAFALQLFLPLPFAAYGAWRLGRALGLRSGPAAVTAAAYTLGGYFLSNTEFTFSSLAAAALPFVCLGALRLRRRPPRPVMLAVSMALLLLAGDPVLAYLASGMCFALVLKLKPPRTWRPYAGLGVAATIAGLLAAVLLLPLREHFYQSGRSLGAMHLSTFWSLDLEQLAGFVVPPHESPIEHLYRSTWLGWLTLALAIFGALQRGRLRVALLVLAALSLGFAMGQWLPLWTWASKVMPGWRAFRFPLKCIGPFALIVALLAGRGAQALARRLKKPRLELVLLVGVVAELAFVNGPLLATAPLPAPPPLATTLQTLGVSPTTASYSWRWVMPPDAGLCLPCAVQTVGPATGLFYDLPTTNAYAPGYSLEYRDLKVGGEYTALGATAPIFGSKYLVRNPPADGGLVDGGTEDAGRVVARDDAVPAIVVELPNPLPLAYLSTGVRRFSYSSVPVVLANENFRRGDEIALAEDDPGPPAREPTGPYVPAVVKRVGADVEVTATATEPSVLVLNASFYRGVHAYERGAEVPVFRVNHLARGVEVGPGEHAVRFTFETPGLPLGAALSGVGVALLVPLVVWERRRRRRR